MKSAVGACRCPPRRRGPAPKIQQQLEHITKLPKAQQRLVMQMLDGVLQSSG